MSVSREREKKRKEGANSFHDTILNLFDLSDELVRQLSVVVIVTNASLDHASQPRDRLVSFDPIVFRLFAFELLRVADPIKLAPQVDDARDVDGFDDDRCRCGGNHV